MPTNVTFTAGTLGLPVSGQVINPSLAAKKQIVVSKLVAGNKKAAKMKTVGRTLSSTKSYKITRYTPPAPAASKRKAA